MPDPTRPDNPSPDIQGLFDDEARLRAEIDRLKREKRALEQQPAPNQDGNKEQDQGQKKDEGKQEQKKDEQPKPPFRKRARHWIGEHPILSVMGVIALLAILVAGYFLLEYLESYESTDDAQVNGHNDPISSRITGTVVGVYVENTHWVAKGQVLVDLDPRDYLVALSQARANLAQAEATIQAQSPNVPITTTSQETTVVSSQLAVTSAEAALAGAERTYESSLADLQQAEANAANADREQKRYGELVGKQEVSREQYDQRATDATAQQALVVSRRATAEAAHRSVQEREAALGQAQRRLEKAQNNRPRQIAVQHATLATRLADAQAAKARVDQALLNLRYCKIRAPAAGIIGDKSVEVGTQVSPGQEMFAITEVHDIWVTANFKETEIHNMHAGQSASIHVDALSQTFQGYVEALPGATGATYSLLPPENATGNYVKVVQRLPVRIRFKPGQPYEDRLRPGMSVEPQVWIK